VCLASSAAAVSEPPQPSALQFNDAFLFKAHGPRVDVSQFSNGNPVLPGEYIADLYVNGHWVGRGPVRFAAPHAGQPAVVCLNSTIVNRFGLDSTKLSEAGRRELTRAQKGECADLTGLVAGASLSFDLSELRLDASIPQASLSHTPHGYIDPELWSAGEVAATIGYTANTFYSSAAAGGSTQNYLGINAGLHFGSWLLHQQSALSTGASDRYQNLATYLQHDIPGLKSQLTIGQAFTDGALFDSVGLLGLQLASDDRMLPASLRSYSPLIRGIAATNARVSVTQQGNKIYETTVAPGPFEIDDLSPLGAGGDLLVTVNEANGSQTQFTVPYASVAQLLRPGTSRFQLAFGQLHERQIAEHVNLVQGTFQYGIGDRLTGYIGTMLSQPYQAGLIGAALNTPVGAFAVDITHAHAEIPSATGTHGESLRLSYSKFVTPTHTNFTVSAYRYASRGFWALREAMYARQAAQNNNAIQNNHWRDQFQITLHQPLGETGSAYLVGSLQDYWDRSGTATQLQVGYSNSFRLLQTQLHYSLSFSRQRDAFSGRLNNQAFLNLSLPLGKSSQAPTVSLGLMQDNHGHASQQLALGGTLGEEQALAYGVTASRREGSSTASVYGLYRAPFLSMTASGSTGAGYNQLSAGINGGIVMHRGGITLANSLGDTIAVVHAPHATGAHITNGSNIQIDRNGYAVLPYMSPYMLNTIDIDPNGIADDVEFKTTSQQIAPRSNTVVMVHFDTVQGRAVLLHVRMENVQASPPLGATVQDSSDQVVGMVGQGGRIFLRSSNDHGRLRVVWGHRPEQSCQIDYVLPPPSLDKRPAHLNAQCLKP
jgi:outer membrane usher protein